MAEGESGNVPAGSLDAPEEADHDRASQRKLVADWIADRGLNTKHLSDHLVRGIDFLFALTLGQGILLFQWFWSDPLHSRNIPVALALLAVYLTTFLSFIDWHIAMDERPYMVTVGTTGEQWLERLRVWIDLLIVMTYAYLLINANDFKSDPNHSLNAFLIGFPIMFVLYIVWELLRRLAYSAPRTSLSVLVGTLVALVAVAACYHAINGNIHDGDIASLSVVIAIIGAFRFLVWWRRAKPLTSS
jgi:hypothetical protein